MSERDQSPAAPRHDVPGQQSAGWRESTTPGLQPVGSAAYSGAGASAVGSGAGGSGAGGPAGEGRSGTGAHGYPEQSESYYTTPQYSTSPVTVRRPDPSAALLLVLAGVAAAVSLALVWVPGASGWDLVSDGFEDFDAGSWQPPVIVLAGGALLVLGLLCLLPARSHKTLGVLALLATMAAAGGTLVALNATEFTWDAFELGFWFALAVPALGLLGSLKAMLTGPKVR
ncbi:hypothetical protein [Trujillonella humicola]|uniref:hypothetical protein n=1 Tax=Trujillonella humicola TaxID=3383699 RepID=UPI003906B88C